MTTATNASYYQTYMADNYDRMSSTYDLSMDYRWRNDNDPRYLFESMVLDSCGTGDEPLRALDVGTGTGRISLLIAKRFPNAEVRGLDQSSQMIDVARAKALEQGLTNVEFDNYSVETELPYPSDRFDLVTCSLAMIYFTDKDRFIAETGRVLRPGGSCLVSTIGPADMNSVLDPFWELYNTYNPSYTNTFNPRKSAAELKAMFQQAGYDEIEVTSCCEDVIFGTLDDYLALFNTYGLSGLLFFLPKSDAVRLMAEYRARIAALADDDGSLTVLREVMMVKARKAGQR